MNKTKVKGKLKDNELPERWTKIRLGEIIIENIKSRFKVENADNSGRYPFFTSGEAILSDSNYLVDYENVFLATGGVANIKYYKGKANYSADTYCLKAKITIKYLYYFLLKNLMKVDYKYFSGSGLKHLQKSDFKKEIFILPSLPCEQQKIAEILETVDEAIDKTDAIIEKYKRIKQGLMQDLLTRGIDENGQIRSEKTHKFKDSPLGRIPEEWEVIELGKIADITSSKRIYFSEYVNEGVSFYRSKEIIEKAVGKDPTSLLYIPLSKFNYLKRKFGIPEAGDILITAVGTLGIPYIIKEDDIFYFKDGNLLWLKKFKQDICEKYLAYILKPLFNLQEEILKIGTSQQALTIEKLRKMKIFSLPLSEQRRIAKILSKIDDTIEKEKKYKEKLERIKQSLMEDLLTGKVRVLNVN